MSNTTKLTRAKPVSKKPKSIATPLLITGGIVFLVMVATLAAGLLFAVMDRNKPNTSEVTQQYVGNDDDLAAWKDNPEMYKGKTFKIKCLYHESGIVKNDKVKEFLVFTSIFSKKKATVIFSVDFSDYKEKTPVFFVGDSATVTFECTEGSLTKGNKAISITR